MIERRQIVDLARRGEAGVLVTLVRAEGSSYRRPGARLLTRSAALSGEAYAGTISGGCLESEVVKKAAWKVRGGPVVEQYSTVFDNTSEVPYGLGCGGVVDLLFEASGTPEFDALVHALEASLGGVAATVITWLPESVPGRSSLFARAIVSPTGAVVFASRGIGPAEIRAALAPQPLNGDGPSHIFVEHIEPPQRLIVLGAGDDARPLVSMAALLGWSVVVADGRAQLARPERFPEAQGVLAASAAQIATLNINSSDAVVLMTHSYEQDRDWLAAVLPIAPRYFGVLGARHRSSLLVAEAAAISGLSLATCCERIFAPVGLDLGGDGPEAIALAVISEAHARCMGRLGASLRLSAADVAARIERGDSSRYLQSHCALDPAVSGQSQGTKVAGVVLAAGASKRLGKAKQDLRLGSETLLERTVSTASVAGLDPVFVVLSPERKGVFDAPARIITNHEAGEGMASSIRAGVRAAMEAGADGVLILACDQPAVTPGHLVELAGRGRDPEGAVASAYAERKGVPAYFPASDFEALLALRGDTGARDLLQTARTVVLQDGDLDIDTAEDWARARRVYDSVPQ